MANASLNEAELGEYCRCRGIYPEQLALWRAACGRANDWKRAATSCIARHRPPGSFEATGPLVEQLLARIPQINPHLGAAITRARRQILLEFYIQTNLERFTPSEEEIDAFIAGNPQLFDDRAAYWLN